MTINDLTNFITGISQLNFWDEKLMKQVAKILKSWDELELNKDLLRAQIQYDFTNDHELAVAELDWTGHSIKAVMWASEGQNEHVKSLAEKLNS